MDPGTHPRGTRPDFTLPRPNPNRSRITDALWWLVCMRLRLASGSQNGGTFARKPGYHNAGENLPDHGAGNGRTDHSIRRTPDRTGPWWREFCSAHDWTFPEAHQGDYRRIDLYTSRLINAMRDPDDLRPDDVYAYTLGQTDGDTVVEGYNEYTNMPETSADKTHLWHRHDSFRRNIIGDFWAMWKALTIDMGWTYAEWLRSTRDEGEDMELTPQNLKDIGQACWAFKPADHPDGQGGFLTAHAIVLNSHTATLSTLHEDVTAVLDAVSEDLDVTALSASLAPALAPLIAQELPPGGEGGSITDEQLERVLIKVFRSIGPDGSIGATDTAGMRA